MSLAPFPDTLVPDFVRTVEVGDFNVKHVNMGFSDVAVKMADRAKIRLNLEYTDRPATDLGVMLTYYNSAKGGWKKFLLPQSIWRHGDLYQDALADASKTQYWRFDGEIKATTIKRGFYSFNFILVSVLSSPTPPPALSFPCQLF